MFFRKKKLTKKKAIVEHRKMWRWIADKTRKRQCCVNKTSYFNLKSYKGNIDNHCFCCEYIYQKGYGCKKCPVVWDSKCDTYMCEQRYEEYDGLGLYGKWCNAVDNDNWQKAAELAEQIAELPERE